MTEDDAKQWLGRTVVGICCACGGCGSSSPGRVVAIKDSDVLPGRGFWKAFVRNVGSSRDYDYSAPVAILEEAPGNAEGTELCTSPTPS